MISRHCVAATAVLTVFGVGMGLTPAAAAGDSAVLTPDAKVMKVFRNGKVKTTALKPAKFSANVFTFPAALEGGNVPLSGGMAMKKGKSLVKLSSLVVHPGTGALDAQVYVKESKQPMPMSLTVPGLMTVTGGTNQLADKGTWSGATVKLSKSVVITGNTWDPAKLLGDTLGVKLKKGAKFAKVTITIAK